jgi:ubiquinone/menaquinone biosynthesis C-methylase UbiE
VKAIGLSSESRVLDLGCSLGGPARYVAATTGAHVTGIDLTRQFVENGRTLTEWTGLTDRVRLVEGSVLDVQLGNGSMDAVYLIHVGMNVADETGIAKEAARVLRQLCKFSSLRVRDLAKTFRRHCFRSIPLQGRSHSSALSQSGSSEKPRALQGKIETRLRSF